MRIIQLLLLLTISLCVLAVPACQLVSSIEQAEICSSVNNDGSPKVAQDNFTPDIKTIYCSIKLRVISSSSAIKGEWFIVNSPEAKLTNYLIGSETIKAEKQYIVFSFERADQVLPAGDYAIKLTYDGQPSLTVPFKIRGDAAASMATLSEATICSSIDINTDQPLDNLEVLPDDVGRIFCTVKVDNANYGDIIRAQWICLKGELVNINNGVMVNRSTRIEGRKYVSSSIVIAEGKKMYKGDYLVKLSIEGAAQLTVPFKIIDANLIPGPYLSEAATFVMGGSDNKTMELSNSFPANVETVYIQVKANNCPEDTSVTLKWMALQTAEGDIVDHLLREETIKTTGTVLVISSITRKSEEFPRGKYAINVLLNGTEKISVPFQIR